MPWDKAPDELAQRFAATLDRFPAAERRLMFGYPAAFVNGNMFTGLFASAWFVRLAPDELQSLHAEGGGDLEPMPGRPMKGYATLPGPILADDARLHDWVGRALAFTETVPPKVKKAARAPKAGNAR